MEKIIQLKDLQPGSSYLIRARAINKYGVVSEWSQTYTLNLTTDDTKPSIPSTPIVQLAGPQKVVVSHPNTKKVGGDLEYDVVAYKVYTNTTATNTGGTLIHTMSATRPGSGISSFATINVNAPLSGATGATVYFYVTAVDSAGNESDPSDATTGKSITYFDSAYISELTADRIRTGTLQANQQISVGTTAPIIIQSNATSPRGQIYIGTTVNPTGAVGSGYKDTQTAFYVDSTGKFSLKDQLYWDGTTLTIQGVLKVGEAEGDITTISGDKVRTGNLISNNYKRIDPATDTGANNLNGIPNDGDPDVEPTTFSYEGTWFNLDSGALYSKGFYITGDGDKDPYGNTITAGTAVFRGEIFGARGIFSDQLSDAVSTSKGFNFKDSLSQTTTSLRKPTLVVESTNTNDGYLVLFKNAGTKSGVEFYVKQGSGTPENNQVNWRRGSLAHLSGEDWPGGVLRLAAYPSSTGLTPGLLHIYAQDGASEPGEIHLDASRVYISKFWVKEDFSNDGLSNFWRDPDSVALGSRFFQVGNMDGSGIEVKKDSNGLPKVSILNYEIIGVAKIVDDSRITIKNVSDTIDLIKIGKNVDGTRDGIFINSNNYWTLNDNSSNVRFRIGDTSGSFVYWDGSTLSVKGSITVTGGDAATKAYADASATSAASAISVLQKLGTEVTGVTITSLGEIFSAGKTSYSSTTNGWYLGWINPSTTPASSRTPGFNIGNNTNYLKWTGSALEVKGQVITGTSLGSGVTFPGGTTLDGGGTYGSGISFALNTIFISDKWNGGAIVFSNGQANPNNVFYGSISPSSGAKFSSLDGDGIMIGNPSYPYIEVGKDTSNANKILLLTASGVGIEIRPSNFVLRGGTSSRITGIPESGTANTKVLTRDNSNNILWADAAGGTSGKTYTSGDSDTGIIVNNTSDTITNAGYRMGGATSGVGNSRVSTRNRITFGGTLPTGPQDGDLHIEF